MKNPQPIKIKSLSSIGIAAAVLTTFSTLAAQRPISDFLSRQATYCVGTDLSGNPTCGSYGGPGCPGYQYVPGFPNFVDWTDPSSGNSVSFDYAGVVNNFMGGHQPTTMSGTINEVVQKDGTVIDTITLHTDNAITWASVGVSGTGTVLFGANPYQITAGATPSLGACNLKVVLKGPAPGAALPDLMELLNGCGDWSFVSIDFTGHASGTLPDGSSGMVEVAETGLLTVAGQANPNSRVALDAFPAEHIKIQATGK
ncbi:MAG TPA: hypothetical protein VLT36_03445 [Candidatus Dormibacteraeota bacterium]|nr:hypothetical protein [Candidatus Dormibacteraeota bacterium]